MMGLFWTPEVIQDREDIYDFIEQDNPAAALDLDELFCESASRLIDDPNSGRPGLVPGSRELVVHKHYMLVYDVAGKQVRILSVVHTARRWPPKAL
ncbi:MAG TPA: type II toxin-antitoxin system RelE/ParE family toxin [Alcanivorax sp.]|nr:type II toxin-antitoxin system RelE/ParE family toxin [Alcanivorax sp.]